MPLESATFINQLVETNPTNTDVIRQGDEVVERIPAYPVGRFGRPLFQVMSYHDTPETGIGPLSYELPAADATKPLNYSISTLNSVGLESASSMARPQ